VRRTLLTVLATALACCGVACGDDGASDDDRAADTNRAADTSRADTPGSAETARSADTNGTKVEARANESTADGVTPPDGGEKVLGGFGREPTEAERAAIVAAVDRYHAAVASDDDARICAQMSRAGKREMLRNVADAKSKRCVDHVGILYSGFSDAIREVLEEAQISELRVKGNHAIVIEIIPGPRTLKLPMEREQGSWRFGTFGEWAPAI
jgi:hypothetical protein